MPARRSCCNRYLGRALRSLGAVGPLQATGRQVMKDLISGGH